MVDLILLLIFIYLIFNGLYRGFFNIFLKILGFGLGVFLGYLFYKPFSIFFSKVFSGNILIIDFMAFSFIV
ncbi:MAG: CvpA family protein, partial [Sulfurihydrogenibium sp.]|nr:CvpA family protein [Sulfurihydrogenibium sp.]